MDAESTLQCFLQCGSLATARVAVWIPQELAVVEDEPELGSILREHTCISFLEFW